MKLYIFLFRKVVLTYRIFDTALKHSFEVNNVNCELKGFYEVIKSISH